MEAQARSTSLLSLVLTPRLEGPSVNEQSGSPTFLEAPVSHAWLWSTGLGGNSDVTNLFVTPERFPEASPGQRDFVANLG